MKKYVILLGVTLAAALLLILIPQLAGSSITTVTAVRIMNGNMKSTISCSGTISSEYTSAVSYGYSMKISGISVAVGDSVKKSQKLMDIDQQATRQGIQSGSVSSQSGSSTVSASSSADSQQSEYLNSLAKQYNLTQYSSSGSASSQSGSSSSASVSQIPSEVCAPISGTVTQISAVCGAFTNPRAAIITISDLSHLEVTAQVEESLITKVKDGQTAYVTGDGFSGCCKGYVARIYPSASQSSSLSGTGSTVAVVVKIEKPVSGLKPNLTANVEIVTSDNPKTIAVPYEAVLQDDSNVEYVFRYRNGRAVRQNVVTGDEYDDCVQVVKGLSQGDEILLNPPSTLKSGEIVRLKTAKTGSGVSSK